MGLAHLVLILNTVAVGTLAVPAAACMFGPPAHHVIVVRFFNQSRLDARSLATIAQVAEHVWAPYGVEIQEGTSGDAINVVVTEAGATPTGSGHEAVLGTTLFSDGHSTPNIRLSLGVAEQLADRGRGEQPPLEGQPLAALDATVLRVLGVALAHELAHYLLDTPDHSAEGLLRARLSFAEMVNAQPIRLSLSCAQRQALTRVR